MRGLTNSDVNFLSPYSGEFIHHTHFSTILGVVALHKPGWNRSDSSYVTQKNGQNIWAWKSNLIGINTYYFILIKIWGFNLFLQRFFQYFLSQFYWITYIRLDFFLSWRLDRQRYTLSRGPMSSDGTKISSLIPIFDWMFVL